MLEKVTTFEAAEVNNEPLIIDRDAKGQFYYYDVKGFNFKVFNEQGKVVRSIGGTGAGPGEFRMARNLLVGADQSLHVIDVSLSRHSVFSPEGKFVRSNPIPPSIGGPGRAAIVLPSNHFVISAEFNARNSAGYALQVVDEKGTRLKMLDEVSYDKSKRWRLRRHLFPRKSGEFWVANQYTFTIDLYSRELENVGSFTRTADWLEPSSEESLEPPSIGLYDKRPEPLLAGIWEDPDGVLWLQLLVPDPNWKAGPSAVQATQQKVSIAQLEDRPRYDTVIEAIDVKTRGVLARLRLKGMVGKPFSTGFVAKYAENSSGEPSVTISRFRLKR